MSRTKSIFHSSLQFTLKLCFGLALIGPLVISALLGMLFVLPILGFTCVVFVIAWAFGRVTSEHCEQ